MFCFLFVQETFCTDMVRIIRHNLLTESNDVNKVKANEACRRIFIKVLTYCSFAHNYSTNTSNFLTYIFCRKWPSIFRGTTLTRPHCGSTIVATQTTCFPTQCCPLTTTTRTRSGWSGRRTRVECMMSSLLTSPSSPP